MLQMVNPSKSLYSTEQAVQWLSEIAEALQYMHSLTPAVSRSLQTLPLQCMLALLPVTCCDVSQQFAASSSICILFCSM